MGLYKTECIRTTIFHDGPYRTIADLEYATAGYVDWYNARRLHGSLGMAPPVEFEKAQWATVYWYFKEWNAEGITDRIHDALRDAVRDRDGRDPMASAGIVDAQSVKGADTVGKDSRGYDAGKKTNGRKRPS